MHRQAVRKLCPERRHALLRRLAGTADWFTAAVLGSWRASPTAIAALLGGSIFRGAQLLSSPT